MDSSLPRDRKRLPDYRHRQLELITILRTIGVNVNDDQDPAGERIPLTEIDAFTFLYFLSKPKNDWNKMKILWALASDWNIPVVVHDVCGIPSPNAQLLWLFPYKYERVNDEINRLWDFFDLALSGKLTDDNFADWRTIHGVERQKISECLFLLNPYEALCLNGKVKPFVQSFGVNTDFLSYSELALIYKQVQSVIPLSFTEISYQGYLNTTYLPSKPLYFRLGTKDNLNGHTVLP
jgi:5-methylcytosine-specific restriction protein B